MIVVKYIDVEEVRSNIVELLHHKPRIPYHELPEYPTEEELRVPVELVHGKVFTNTDGKKVCIGMSGAAQIALGLPFEVFENLREDITKQRVTVTQYKSLYAGAQRELNQMRTMSFWDRVKFLFNRQSA